MEALKAPLNGIRRQLVPWFVQQRGNQQPAPHQQFCRSETPFGWLRHHLYYLLQKHAPSLTTPGDTFWPTQTQLVIAMTSERDSNALTEPHQRHKNPSHRPRVVRAPNPAVPPTLLRAEFARAPFDALPFQFVAFPAQQDVYSSRRLDQEQWLNMPRLITPQPQS